MGKITLRIFLLSLALLAVTQWSAQAATFRFKSTVEPRRWTTTLSGTLVTPKGKGPFPVVIFLHPCSDLPGLVRKSLNTHAQYLARHGFATLIPNSFDPRNLSGGKACGGPLANTGTNLLIDDAFNAKAALAKSPKFDADNIFIAGQSLGATAALRASTKSYSRHDGAFRAAVAWYPRCFDIVTGADLKSPLLVLGGSADDWTPPGNCERPKKHNRMSGADYEVIVYKGALHGFDQPRGRYRYHGHWLGYDAAATAAGRKAMLAFFQAHLKK